MPNQNESGYQEIGSRSGEQPMKQSDPKAFFSGLNPKEFDEVSVVLSIHAHDSKKRNHPLALS
jgi:hypothetical protein